MFKDKNIITIYGKPGKYKSSLGINILKSFDSKKCYIDMEGNERLGLESIDTFNNVSIINEKFILNCIDKYDVILIDYIELLNINDDILTNIISNIKNKNKNLILISCCSSSVDIFNDNYNKLKKISDLIITTDN